MSRSFAYQWRKEDPTGFGAAWEEALKIGVSALEDEVHRRAFEGLLKPVYQGGVKVGAIREYSDTLAIFLLKAHNPAKYRENQPGTNSPELQAVIAGLMAHLSKGLPG